MRIFWSAVVVTSAGIGAALSGPPQEPRYRKEASRGATSVSPRELVAESSARRERQLTNTACASTECQYQADGYCDDGGPGAQYASCPLGTDCDDCPSRYAASAPPAASVTPPAA
eukprot:5030636-Prymnesium_polylepis.1